MNISWRCPKCNQGTIWNDVGWFLIYLLCYVGLFSMFDCGDRRAAIKQEAVKRGYAHWSVSEKGGVSFEWNDPKEKE